jgi:aminoglycoside 6'-N-acetyltransferase I
VHILNLTNEMFHEIEQAALLLVLAFSRYGAWTTMEEARQEVQETLAPDRILRLALEGDIVLGWIGGAPEYDGKVWVLHPLVVRPERQRQGIGTALVRDFEAQVRERGGITILLGTDDMDFQTTLGGVNLYENTWEHIRTIRNLKSHPYEFYRKLGYTIVGVVPDANGRGKPDIYMAKRV